MQGRRIFPRALPPTLSQRQQEDTRKLNRPRSPKRRQGYCSTADSLATLSTYLTFMGRFIQSSSTSSCEMVR